MTYVLTWWQFLSIQLFESMADSKKNHLNIDQGSKIHFIGFFWLKKELIIWTRATCHIHLSQDALPLEGKTVCVSRVTSHCIPDNEAHVTLQANCDIYSAACFEGQKLKNSFQTWLLFARTAFKLTENISYSVFRAHHHPSPLCYNKDWLCNLFALFAYSSCLLNLIFLWKNAAEEKKREEGRTTFFQ